MGDFFNHKFFGVFTFKLAIIFHDDAHIRINVSRWVECFCAHNALVGIIDSVKQNRKLCL